jgi:hypothetical protein
LTIDFDTIDALLAQAPMIVVEKLVIFSGGTTPPARRTTR